MIRVPAHVTGFFYPIIKDNPLESGSLGAGFSLTKYVYTEVKLNNDSKIRVFFNDKEVTDQACTSYVAAKELLNYIGEKRGVIIKHKFEIPIGCGLASSGAGALGVVFGINEELDIGLKRIELAKFAHIAEVKCKTGLGSVIAQYDGMFEIRIKAGSPGLGVVLRFPVKENVAILVYGEIETKKILSSKNALKRVKYAFGEKHLELLKNFSVENFCRLSRDFATQSGLLSEHLKYLLNKASYLGLNGSMLMLGDGVFLFGEDLNKRVKKLLDQLDKNMRPRTIIFAEIDNYGVTQVDENDS